MGKKKKKKKKKEKKDKKIKRKIKKNDEMRFRGYAFRWENY